ncbi:E3 ubiquitin-protein ligase SIN-like [Senna tora]|uniref:E3 ubiquitin-protein ligase SIN-like n=1 Tax=Senna tora TaxID=362788 RepID=A0A834WW52_9FABA|nr:E3 ubiquitin-protein ligase SIN-like [Senna tora]
MFPRTMDLSLHLTTKYKDSALRFAYDKYVSVSLNLNEVHDFVVLREENCGHLFILDSVAFESTVHRKVGIMSLDGQRSVSFIGSAMDIRDLEEVIPATTDWAYISSFVF